MKPNRAIPVLGLLAATLFLSGVGEKRSAPAGESGFESWPTWPESASVRREDYVSLSCPVIVYATADDVWEILTTVRSFSLWYPHWKPEDDMLRTLGAVGDSVAFYCNGEPAGRSVVTWYDPPKCLRIVHELAGGGIYGSIEVSLERTDRGVGMAYSEMLPAAVTDVQDERRRVCGRAVLIKRLAEGE